MARSRSLLRPWCLLVIGLGLSASGAPAWSQDQQSAPEPAAPSEPAAPASAPAAKPGQATRHTSRRPYANTGVHLAIERGLIWLARHQNEQGAWTGATVGLACAAVDPKARSCQPETALDKKVYASMADVGCTALALLAFIRAGQGEDSSEIIEDSVNKRRLTTGKDVVLEGLTWLVSQQRPDGSFSDPGSYYLYNEAIATLTLSEAYGLTGREQWKAPAQKAADFLCKAQKPNPTDPTRRWGWRYQPAGVTAGEPADDFYPSDADMSVTGWMVMALKSARAAGLEVPQAALDGALDFTRWSTAESGLVGYLGPDSAGVPIRGEHEEYAYHFGTMGSIGMCVRMALTGDADDPILLAQAERLMQDLPTAPKDPLHIDYYYWYYGTQAVNQLDGPDGLRRPSKYATPWNKVVTETILDLQDRKKGACTFGGWMKPDRWAYGFGPVYTTAINLLSLEACYRY